MATSAAKAKTNWHLVIWPILVMWIASAVYVYNSEFKDQAAIALPLIMVGAAFLVFVANGIAGSMEQARLDMQADYGDATECTCCGAPDCELQIIDYEYCLFLAVVVIQRSIAGKLCRECAVKAINRAFLTTVFGCILCPPLILFSWFKRSVMLGKFDNAPAQRLNRDE
jgi:hypothetical protein